MKSYEEWSARVRQLQPSSGEARRVTWDGHSGVLGVSLTAEGQVEVLIRGPELSFRHSAVKRRVSYQTWSSNKLGDVTTNTLLLPPGSEFIPAAAWICAELQREGVDDHPQKAVDRTESVLALILDGLAESAKSYTGLLGELHVLASLIERCPPGRRADIAHGWNGHSPSLRDITLGTTGIEVKTTSTAEPTHRFDGVHQVEATSDESHLAVISIGVEVNSQAESTRSLEEELERIEGALHEELDAEGVSAIMDTLRVHVDEYGVVSSTSLKADALQRKLLRDMRFAIRWVRSYDSSSSSIRLPTHASLAEASPYLRVDSIQFSLHLPTDPATPGLTAGMAAVADACLSRSGLAHRPYGARHGNHPDEDNTDPAPLGGPSNRGDLQRG